MSPTKTQNTMKEQIKAMLAAMSRSERKAARAAIGEALWSDSTPLAQDMNLANILKGRTRKIDPDAICAIAKILHTDPNTLLGW